MSDHIKPGHLYADFATREDRLGRQYATHPGWYLMALLFVLLCAIVDAGWLK